MKRWRMEKAWWGMQEAPQSRWMKPSSCLIVSVCPEPIFSPPPKKKFFLQALISHGKELLLKAIRSRVSKYSSQLAHLLWPKGHIIQPPGWSSCQWQTWRRGARGKIPWVLCLRGVALRCTHLDCDSLKKNSEATHLFLAYLLVTEGRGRRGDVLPPGLFHGKHCLLHWCQCSSGILVCSYSVCSQLLTPISFSVLSGQYLWQQHPWQSTTLGCTD